MQPSAGLPSRPASADLPHTRTRPVHWLATTAALAAVLGGAALIQPAGATATPPVAARHAPDRAAVPVPEGAPDAAEADYPLDCGGGGVQVLEDGASDLDGDGREETVAVVRCEAGMGTPPSGVYVLTHAADPGYPPRVLETLVDPAEGMTVTDLAVAGRTVSATLLGYSSKDVPRCCPDRRRAVKWQWQDGKFRLTALPVTRSV
ncbi:hypothetical protein [Streptomyces sp. NPDC048845]|uniref:hypothetical protein n=1 Tax=Streptomyces sp. NPDC048845 TaxID=3155390 RepID=UPI003437E29F